MIAEQRCEHCDWNAAPSLRVLGGCRESRDPAVLVGRADGRNGS